MKKHTELTQRAKHTPRIQKDRLPYANCQTILTLTEVYGPAKVLDGLTGNKDHNFFVAKTDQVNEWLEIDFGRVIGQISQVTVSNRVGSQQTNVSQ